MNNATRRVGLAVAVLGLLVGATGRARADLIVAPGAQANVEGNTDNGFPFNFSGIRYQQVFAASEFSSIVGPEYITQIIFRPDAIAGHAFSSTLSDIQIDLSTTSQQIDGLSTTFASNVGADDTVVYGRGALSLSSAFTGPAGGPKAFDIVINLATPFLFNPSNGNLLLDVRNYGTSSTSQFDAQITSGDGTSRLYNFGSATATSGTADTSGLVTQFNFTAADATAVPEPSTFIMAVVAGLFGLGYGWRRRERASVAA